MTPQEAIKAMKFYKEKLYNGIFNQFIAAFDVAISALEKQIPKKPIRANRIIKKMVNSFLTMITSIGNVLYVLKLMFRYWKIKNIVIVAVRL